ncbi:hypothetical protein [Bradyrhizobium sp. AUGA SZCCT0182]|uniref:hypothetical protein n=1 Tax=Bradyrhizobium sp. AUGA SZCCT0182 TaxID=2807667 RepID=UPI002011BBF5|nr:hypothetical protein [Bradyrhizobium sp. AUGA SZCCT0182]
MDAALLDVCGLFNGNHLPLHLGKLGCGLLVAADEKRGWPKDDNGRSGCQAVVGSLLILNAR